MRRPPARGLERLDARLRQVVETEAPDLAVELSLPPLSVRGEVVAAIAGCVGEALRNISRHADVGTARVDASMEESGLLRVETRDDGLGFDPHEIAEHRRGIRDSIVARMTDVGGRAEIVSAPANGTRVILRWSGDDTR